MNEMKMLLPLDIQYFAETMNVWDAIAGGQGECFITIQGRRYNWAQMKNIQADMEKRKSQLNILGRVNAGNKSNGVTYAANATMYYNTSILREMLYHYKETGQDIYFEVQVTNHDKGSSAGRQSIVLVGCNLDGGVLALLDVDAEALEESVSFTFEDWEMPEKFKILDVMNS